MFPFFLFSSSCLSCCFSTNLFTSSIVFCADWWIESEFTVWESSSSIKFNSTVLMISFIFFLLSSGSAMNSRFSRFDSFDGAIFCLESFITELLLSEDFICTLLESML